MPLYTIHVSHKSIANFTSFSKALVALHGKTFNTDPLAVRVIRSTDSSDLDYYVHLSLHLVNLVLCIMLSMYFNRDFMDSSQTGG